MHLDGDLLAVVRRDFHEPLADRRWFFARVERDLEHVVGPLKPIDDRPAEDLICSILAWAAGLNARAGRAGAGAIAAASVLRIFTAQYST